MPHTNSDDLFFSASPEELAKGVKTDAAGIHHCLICFATFQSGCVYDVAGTLYEGERAAREHVQHEHGDTGIWLADLNKRLTGLTDTQRLLLHCMREGLDDKQIAARMGISASTVRNHRFQMRERARQARVFLALMLLTEQAPVPQRPHEELMADNAVYLEIYNSQVGEADLDMPETGNPTLFDEGPVPSAQRISNREVTAHV
jgi:hypothetical protein